MNEASQQEEKREVTHADLDRAAELALMQESEAVEEEEEETVETAAEEEVEEKAVEEEESEETEELQAVEEETEEQAIEPETKAKDEENAERSRLGRKVKTLEDQLSRLVNLLETKETVKTEQLEEDDEEADAYITPENLPKYIERETKKREAEQVKYQQNYVANFSQIGKDDDNFTDIWEEMLANHNTVVTGDPKADAQINYFKAKASIFENRKPVNPVQGKSKTVKTKVNVPDKIQEKQPKPIKLDPIAAEFVKRQKLSTEFVEKTLNK